MTITGKTLADNIAGAEVYNTDVIRTLDNPVLASGGLAILYGNLAPNGAVIKSFRRRIATPEAHGSRHRFRQLRRNERTD